MALNLFGVTFIDPHEVRPAVPDTSLVAVRDLGAIVGESEYATLEPTPERVRRHAEIVSAFAATGPVLPAPVGVVFKSQDAVERWLALHFVALSSALGFVENKVMGRVHVSRPGVPEEREAGIDLAAAAAEALRAVRRAAVTTVPLRTEKAGGGGIILSAAYLVERDMWKELVSVVAEQGQSMPGLRFELTGPWPPYDFVQMQLGA